MRLTGNTILITGAGSGIGRALAEELHQLGNQVIIAGRRQAMLDATTAANPGMHSLALDVEDPEAIRAAAAQAVKRFPALNVLINNAGIMRPENLRSKAPAAQPEDLAIAEATVAINLLGPIRLTTALLPHLKKQAYAAVMNVSSGLAFVPLAFTPTYCATKAAIHSYTESLRFQLRGSPVEVLELIPPYVQTDLLGGADDPRAMPLKDFIAEVMEILKTDPACAEVCVKSVVARRQAIAQGQYTDLFEGMNAAMAGRFQ